MGMRETFTRFGVKTELNKKHNLSDPYSHLAVSIIIQAYEDLKALNGQEKAMLASSAVSREEILRFLRSDWCALLLSCQGKVTQDRIEAAALAVLEK